MIKTIINVVPKKEVRNQGIGDYKLSDNKLKILVANNAGDNDEKVGVAIHELIESALALKRKIRFEDINKFDKDNIKHPDPGNLQKAPYHKEHMFANKIEDMVVRELKKHVKN